MPVALVTGATGQDGYYLCSDLVAGGFDVHTIVRPDDGSPDPGLADLERDLPQVRRVVCDLTDATGLRRAFDEIEPDEVYNFGGLSSVALSWREPVLTGAVTGLAVAGLLEAAWQVQERLGRPVRVVQASSAEIFGAAQRAPQDESTPIRPVTPYGAAKAYAHHMVGVYRARGLHASAVILYNHESPRRPETFVTRKITAAAARIAAGRQDELVLGSLEARRDWGWAPDYVQAAVLAARAATAGDYVVATGVAHSVADLVAAAFARVGIDDWRSLVRTDPQFVRAAEAPLQVGDASKARRLLGWAPTKTFDEIVAAMVDHDVALLAAGADV